MLAADLRLYMLVQGTAGPGGHAMFGGDGPILEHVDPKTGEVKPFTRRYMNKLLRKGIKGGVYEPQSTLRCIVLPLDLWDVGIGYPATPCPEHGHNMSSVEGQWVDPAKLIPEQASPSGRNSLFANVASAEPFVPEASA